MAEPCIVVLAGTNGAGKSSVGGELLLQNAVPYFDPDVAAREVGAQLKGLSLAEANSLAWREGLAQLRAAIRLHQSFAFETTLGGKTITATLEEALDAGLQVRVWYVGLTSPERHIARVAARAARGGHAIPEDKIRERYGSSRLNLIRLMPRLTELKVFDNSVEADPWNGTQPMPRLVLHMLDGKIIGPAEKQLRNTPEWAKPIVGAALTLREALSNP